MKPVSLPIAIRVFPGLKPTPARISKNKVWRQPRAMLVFDTETRTDASQRLTFGSYRFFVDNEQREDGLFLAEDWPQGDGRSLEKYVAVENQRASAAQSVPLLLLTRRKFLKKFYKAVYKGRAL